MLLLLLLLLLLRLHMQNASTYLPHKQCLLASQPASQPAR